MEDKEQRRNRTVAIRVTTAEKEKIIKYAKEHCVNTSALIRKMLFERLDRENRLSQDGMAEVM